MLRDLIGIAIEAEHTSRPASTAAVSVIAEQLLPDHLLEWDEWVGRSWTVLARSDDPWATLERKTIEQLPLSL
jgi:hypothetical protein